MASSVSPKTPDQARADAWIAELEKFAHDGEMPKLEVMHLPDDRTAGGRAGYRTPRAYMEDNDLALGRIVDALSKSLFWKDTVIFVLEACRESLFEDSLMLDPQTSHACLPH